MHSMVEIKISLCGTSSINNNSFVHSSACSEHLNTAPMLLLDVLYYYVDTVTR